MKAKPAWWILPSIITGSLAMLGGLGTCAIKYATYESLPSKVEAAEQKNELQDDAILELKKTNEVWQQIYQQQQAPNRSTVEVWRDDDGLQWCCETQCGETMNWWRCDR